MSRVLGIGLALAVLACSPSPTTGPSAAPSPSGREPSTTPGVLPDTPPVALEVLEMGFTPFPDDAANLASYGAVLRNPNEAWSAQRAEFKLDFLDSGGAFLAGADVVVTLLPGQTTAIAGQVSGAGGAASLEVHPPEDTEAFIARPASDEGFDVAGLTTERNASGWLTTGTLTSRFATAQTFVQLVAIHRAADGAILGGATGGIDAIQPGGASPFEILDGSPYPAIGTTDIHWHVTR